MSQGMWNKGADAPLSALAACVARREGLQAGPAAGSGDRDVTGAPAPEKCEAGQGLSGQ